jgi:hypothetical protein
MVNFWLKLLAVLVIWKNNTTYFTAKIQTDSDPGNSSDCIVVTLDYDNGCEVEHPMEQCCLHNDIDQSLKENYDTMISVVSLTCGDALFQGICNYLQTVEDAEFLK